MKVSVVVITYNHERYIRQALESVLMQETDFEFEILISEDCSTDGTREIVEEYASRDPGKVRLLLSDHNVRTNAVVARAIHAALGEYVAMLDGDDYWTSRFKLKKQADFLDAHPECSMCFHNATVLREDAAKAPWNWTAISHPEISTLDDMLLGNFVATCSTMFRRRTIVPIPRWYDDFFPITDWPLHILNAERGDIGYINEVLGVYRHHEGGLYSPLTEREKLAATLSFYRRINECLRYRYNGKIQAAMSNYFFEWAEEYLRRNDTAAARACFLSYMKGRPVNRHVTMKRMVRTALRLYVPALS